MSETESKKPKVTMTVGEDDILEYAHRIQENHQEDVTFAARLSSLIQDPRPHTNPIHVGSTPIAIQILSVRPLDIIINPKTVKKCMSPEKTDGQGRKLTKSGHGLTAEELSRIPQQIRNPVMIFSGSQPDSLVLITDMKDSKQREIMIALLLHQHDQHHEVHRITSMYGRDAMRDYLSREIEAGHLLACNIEKANEMLQSLGLYLPQEETFIGFDDSIAYSEQNVKRGSENRQNEHEKTDPKKQAFVFPKQRRKELSDRAAAAQHTPETGNNQQSHSIE